MLVLGILIGICLVLMISNTILAWRFRNVKKMINKQDTILEMMKRIDSRVAVLMERTKSDVLATFETDIIQNAAAALSKKGTKVKKTEKKKKNQIMTNGVR